MNIYIYQIQYNDDVIGTFDPAFIKYDCRANPEEEKREVAHMLRFYKENLWKNKRYSGLVSPKFSSKTGIAGQAFIDWIEANPGYDVYFVNPFPQLSYLHFNVWSQGEFWHPGLGEMANEIFTQAGISVKVENLPRNTVSSLLYCNYWVGNENFWHCYMNFLNKIIAGLDRLDVAYRNKLFQLAPHYSPATYFPFVFERMFSTFLVMHKDIAGLPYTYTKAEILTKCDNEMERFIIREWAEMIDNWDAAGWNFTESKKIFANLHGMVQLHQTITPCENIFVTPIKVIR